MRIRLSMILVRCTFLGVIGFALVSFQASHVLAAQASRQQMKTGVPLSVHNTHVKSLDDTATISISASTNTCSSTINVYVTGIATYKTCAQQGQRTLSRDVLVPFFQDIRLAQPLNALPNAFCFKSVSFGTSIHISTGGKSSPDISCSNSPLERNLVNDVHTIEGILQSNSLSHPLR